MATVLDLRLKVQGLSLGLGHCVVFLGIKHVTVTVPLSTQV